jgi:hypothetical protein
MRVALLLAGVIAAAPMSAQIPNTWEGEAMVGVTGQNDTQKLDRVQLSPIGLNIGFIVQPIFGKRTLSLSNQLSFYPSINYDRPVPFDTSAPPSTKPLILNTTWVRLGTSEPEAEGKFVYFAGAGVGLAVATPRGGSKVSPVVGIGMRRWFSRQLGVEISVQCSLPSLGKTNCQVPLSSVWPFGGSKDPTGGS